MDDFDYEAALAGCARRSAPSLRAIYDRDGPFLAGVALRIVKRPEVARDVLHDAFLDIWQRAQTYDPARGAARAWIVSVVRHRAFKAVRRSGRETALDPAMTEAVPDDAPDALAALSASQDAAALRRCLERLEPVRRDVILLAYVDGLSQSDIARKLATPLGTIKAWIRRSLISLRECLA